MKSKSILAGLVMLVAAASTQAAPPVIGGSTGGWNYNFILRSIRWDANENSIWFNASPANAPTEQYYFHYIYASGGTTGQAPETGNSLEEAKGLFTALSLARSLNKQISFQVIKQAVGRYVFTAIGLQE